jgi:hypothetical protein
MLLSAQNTGTVSTVDHPKLMVCKATISFGHHGSSLSNTHISLALMVLLASPTHPKDSNTCSSSSSSSSTTASTWAYWTPSLYSSRASYAFQQSHPQMLVGKLRMQHP